MKPEVENLLRLAAQLPFDRRAEFLRQECPDQGVRAEVESLLQYASRTESYFEDAIQGVALSLRIRSELSPGERIGSYRIVALIGHGGMGSVYLAERADGEIRQKVAVKVLRADGHTAISRERFLKERQLLASLHHSSIVHVIDAGHTGDDQPFLVMEYVEGVPIDAYAAGIDVAHRLRLFLRVCDGVSHAHRRLIIHRDLKPSNILVDGSGQPKLLDFGIAKVLEETGEATQTLERLATPTYASPEQLAGAAQTTATDIYSLGAVLYKLLAGVAPRENSPRTPDAEIPPPRTINPDVPRDVDFIVRKALRAEPEERYVSVDELANDIRAALSWRPVQARSGDAWYRMRRYFRRYWVPAGAAALVMASLSAGLYIANRERAIAQRRFLEVRQLANKLFEIDLEARKFAGSTRTRQVIVDTSLEYLRRLSADAHGDPDLALDVGNAYMRVARVQGVPISQNLGQMDQAEQNLRHAEKFLVAALASQPANRTVLLRLAQAAHDRMVLARFNGRNDEALEFARKSAEWLEKFHAGNSDHAETSAILVTYLNVANQYTIGERFEDAVRLCRRGSELARLFNSQMYLGNFLWVAGEVFRRQGNLDEALRQTGEAARVLEPDSGSTDQTSAMNFILALTHHGRTLGEDHAISLGRSEQAAGVLERAFKMADTFVHKDPSDQMARGRLALAGLSLADILRHSDSRRALTVYDHILRHMAEFKDNSSFRRYEVSALAGSTYPLRRLGRPAEARQRLDRAFERLRRVKSYPAEKINPGSEPGEALSALAEYEADNGNLRRASELCTELLQLVLAAKPKPEASLSDAMDLSNIYRVAAPLHRRAGQAGLASELEGRRLELWQRWNIKAPDNAFVRRQLDSAHSTLRACTNESGPLC